MFLKSACRGEVRLFACYIAIFLVLAAAPTMAAGGSPGRVHLKIGSFDPTVSLPELPERLRQNKEPEAGVFVVQFNQAIDPGVLQRIRTAGAETLKYLPDNSYLVRLPAGAAAAIRGLSSVRWLGPVQPGWKLAPDLGTRPFQDPSRRIGGRMDTVVDLFPGADGEAVSAQVAATGAEMVQIVRFGKTVRLKVRGVREQLEQIAGIPEVAWIEEAAEITSRNEEGQWVVQTDVVDSRTIWDHGLHGEGQVIGHIDGRININSCWFSDPVNNTPGPGHRKIVAYRSASGLGTDSHGTHTAGTVAGNQEPVNGVFTANGHAYMAKISHTNSNDVSGFNNSSSNLYANLEAAHQDGARVHTNSWGDDGTTVYTTWCEDIDQFSYDYEDSLVLFAETNGSALKTPENAKNVLAVGATQRGASADNHCSGGTGPASDGRRKPEIYAPGCSTSSASTTSCSTTSKTGTSMACPAVTGAGALVRQYFEEGWYPSGAANVADTITPSGALVKATLLNSTVDMTGVTGYPSNREGWGRVLLENSLYFNGDIRATSLLADIRNLDGFVTGEEASFPVQVTGNGEPLKITLVWTEPAAANMASQAAINDLDLEVRAPSGALYLGNVMDTASGVSVTGGSADTINNVEMVILNGPETGEWTVTVKGTAVNEGTQGFALVASGEVTPFVPGALRYVSHLSRDDAPLGNADGIVDPGETITLELTLRNAGSTTITGISGTMAGDRPDLVKVTRPVTAFPDTGPDSSTTSSSPHYRYTVSPDAPCGTIVRFEDVLFSSDGEGSVVFRVEVGKTRLDQPGSGTPVALPKKSATPVSSTVDIGDSFTLQEVDVELDIAHGDVGELIVQITSPQGTAVTLHNQSGAGTADLTATYDAGRQPDGPGSLADFNGQQAQGTWTLSVTDNTGGRVKGGSLNGWTLMLKATTPISCTPLACGDAVPDTASGARIDAVNGSDLQLSWDPMAGASGYRVWKSISREFAEEKFVGSTSSTALTESGGLTDLSDWYYQVRAVNSCEWEGP